MKTSSGHVSASLFAMRLQRSRSQVRQDLGSNIWGELGISHICCFHLSHLSLIFSAREGVVWRGNREGGGALLTHKPVNAVALSTFSSNENFRHLHINLISCLSLLLFLSPSFIKSSICRAQSAWTIRRVLTSSVLCPV